MLFRSKRPFPSPRPMEPLPFLHCPRGHSSPRERLSLADFMTEQTPISPEMNTPCLAIPLAWPWCGVDRQIPVIFQPSVFTIGTVKGVVRCGGGAGAAGGAHRVVDRGRGSTKSVVQSGSRSVQQVVPHSTLVQTLAEHY